MFWDELPESLRKSLQALAREKRDAWADVNARFPKAEHDWMTNCLVERFPDVDEAMIAFLRYELHRGEIGLTVDDRSRLRALTHDERVEKLRVTGDWTIANGKVYQELDQILADTFKDRRLTAIRLRALSLQLTDYLFGFGDMQETQPPEQQGSRQH